jgi:hypothetical protein
MNASMRTSLRTSSRTFRLSVAGLAAAALLSVPATAVAATGTGTATSVSEQAARTPLKTVNKFFTEYLDAYNNDLDTGRVRAKYLTSELDTELDKWAADNHADPVLRAQNVPLSWDIRSEGSGMGHSTVVVTEHFGGGDQEVWFQVRLSDLKIDGLRD